MSVLYKIGGWDAQFAASFALISYVLTILTLGLMNSGLHFLLVLLIMSFVLGASTHHFLIRPHLFSIFFTMLIAKFFLKIEIEEKPLSYLALLFPICVVWANIHGGVLSCYLSFLFLIFCWTAFSHLKMKSPLSGNSEKIKILLIFLFCGLSCLVSPYALELPKTWLNIMSNPAVGENIIEHFPATKLWWGWLTIISGILYISALLGVPKNEMRGIYLLPIAWFLLAVTRIRHAPIFATYLAVILPHFLEKISWATWLKKKGISSFSLSEVNEQYRIYWIFPFFFIAICFFIQFCDIRVPLIGKGWAFPSPLIWPTQIEKELKSFGEAEKSEKGVPIFDEMVFGGYLINRAPVYKVFMDDRCELHGDSLDEFARARKDFGIIKKWDCTFNFRAALILPESSFDEYFTNSNDWVLKAECTAAKFYIKKNKTE
ncbi:MAG: hypothetical protein HQM08_13060 [Candidatus Riflebacteria bacterium]|nr:hypothetical protein [Candidatus Riflebacteria bacterium]